ncbi:MAG: hypothetical protein M0Z45_00090 [Actinomycetota bacterium]|nr:hypothetical protein [Actinomycetota bacterium]
MDGDLLLDVVVDFSASSVPKLGANSIWASYSLRIHKGRSRTLPYRQDSPQKKDGPRQSVPTFKASDAFDLQPLQFKVGEKVTVDTPRLNAVESVNIATRRQLSELILLLVESAPKEASVRIGFDFSLGFPKAMALLLGRSLDLKPKSPLTGTSEEELDLNLGLSLIGSVASLIVDGGDNSNNRLEVASTLNCLSGLPFFWGIPNGIKEKRPDLALENYKTPIAEQLELRVVETLVKDINRLYPFSIRQLFGVGAVGSQSLLGMALVEGLRRELGPDQVALWPYERGRRRVTIFEIWPSLSATKRQLRVDFGQLIDRFSKGGVAIDALETLAVLRQLSWIDLEKIENLGEVVAERYCGDKGHQPDRRGQSDNKEIHSSISLPKDSHQNITMTNGCRPFTEVEETIMIEGWIGNFLPDSLGQS